MEEIQKYSSSSSSGSPVISSSANSHHSQSKHFKSDSSELKRTSKALNQNSHTTAELHALQQSLERFYHSLEVVDTSYDDLNFVPQFQDVSAVGKASGGGAPSALIENVFHAGHADVDRKYVRPSCSEERGAMPYLSAFFTGDFFQLSFSSRTVSTFVQ